MKKLSTGVRIWIVSLVVLALLLGVKSYLLDSWQPEGEKESKWMVLAQNAISNETVSWSHASGILSDRIVNIKEIPSDKAGAPAVLKVTIRTYVGGYLPFGDRKLTIPSTDSEL